MNAKKTPPLRRAASVRAACALLLALCLGLPQPATAFHFPWDQGHDTTDWNDPNNPGPCEGPLCDPCSSTGSPVYLPTGHFVWTENDVELPGRPALTVSRTFNSHDPRDGMFGRGWASECDKGLYTFNATEKAADGTVSRYSGAVLRASNGKRYTFRGSAATGFTAPPGRSERLTVLSGGSLRMTASDGSSRTFSAQGRLTAEASPAGNLLQYAYDGAGRLLRINDSAGRSVTFAYNSRGRVDSLTDHAGRVWRYGYDATGNLTSVTNPAGGIRRYEYRQFSPVGDGHSYSQLTKITDESGVVLTAVTYNGERVSRYTVGQNAFNYTYNLTARTATKTDSLGSQWVFGLNADGQIISVRDPAGGTETYGFHPTGKLNRYVDASNRTWTWTVDDSGRLTSGTNPAGETLRWEYDGDRPSPVRAVSPTGRVTLASYDTHGNLASVTDPAQSTTSMTWSADGNLREVRDALGQSTAITTNAAGLPLTVRDPLGRVTTFTYGAAGRIATATNHRGDVLRFEHDALGRPTAMVEASGARTVYTRDAAGRVLTVVDPAGRTTTYAYDTYGRATSRTLPDGRSYTFRYRADNLVSEVTRPDGSLESYAYDAAKRVTSATRGGITTTYGYDARHKLTSATNPTGTVTLGYDSVGRLVSETANGQTVTHAYNAEGERTGLSAVGASLQFTLDARGAITSLVAPEGTYGLTYDALGRRTRLQYPNGAATAYTYNAGNQLTRQTSTGAFAESFAYTYDDAGLLTRATSGSADWTYGYDADGQLTSASGAGQSLAFTYDAAGNGLSGGRTYDGANRLTEDALHTYTYDAAGQLTQKRVKATGARTQYAWNGLQQLVSIQRFADADATTPTDTTTFTYDALKRRASRTHNGVTERYVYDGSERLATLDASGAVVERVTHGPRVDEPLGLSGAAGARYLHADHLGSIVGVSGASATLGTYQYGPFGQSLGAAPAVANPFRYAARELEGDDDLYFNRARYYDARAQRFLSEDPLGLVGGDTNLYRYAANNPIAFKDPRGEAIWFAIPIIWAGIEIGLSIYDAYDTASTLADPCKSAGEKWLAGGLFLAGAVLPGGGYSAADDIITSKPLREGIYEFVDTSGKKYVGQSNDVPRRLQEHIDSGKLDGSQHVDTTPMPGSTKTEREIAEHNRIQEITGGVPARQSDAVSNQRDPIGPNRQHLLNGGGP